MTQTRSTQAEPEIIPPDAAFRQGRPMGMGAWPGQNSRGFTRTYILRPGRGTLIFAAAVFAAATVALFGIFILLLPAIGIFAALLILFGLLQRNRYLRRM